MSEFVVRVQLHYATEDHHDRLHHAMEARGFSRQVRGADGLDYHLPQAQYHLAGAYTAEQVCWLAEAAATETGLSHSILVTTAEAIYWVNLAPVRRGGAPRPAHAAHLA
jgi:hypothetical protein